MSKKTGLIISIFCFFQLLAISQEFNSVVYTSDEGLPDNYVYSIGRYHNGYLWIGTSSGLAKYDGYSIDPIAASSPIDNQFISSQTMDQNGDLWLGLYDGTIAKLDDNQLKTVIPSADGWGKISSILYDSTANAIVALSVYGSLIKISETDTQIIGLNIPEPFIKMVGHENNLYIQNKLGIYTYDLKSLKASPIISSDLIDFDLSKNTLVYTTENGLFLYALAESTTKKIAVSDGLLTSKCDKVFVKNNKVFVLHKGKGISLLNLKNEQVITYHFSDQSGLPMLNYQSLFVDEEGILWLGTYGEGLVKAELALFNVIKTNFEHSISAIYKDALNCIWVASNRNLYKQDLGFLKRKKFILVMELEDNISSIASGFGEELLLGTEHSGLLIYNPNSESIAYKNSKNGFFSNKITNIYNDSKGSVCISSLDNGVLIVDSLSQKHFNTSNGLTHNYILSSSLDNEKRLWFSTHRTSLSYLDIDNYKFTILKPKAINFGLEVNGICQDIDSNIWFATNGNGLLKFSNNAFSWVGRGKGQLLSNFCYSVFPDLYNNLWVSHKDGFSVLNTKENSTIMFELKDGFSMGSKSTNSIIELDKSNILAISGGNLVEINTSLIAEKPSAPSVSIRKLRINGQDHNFKGYEKLKYANYSFEFNYTGISFKKGSPIQYKYKIEGLDDNWSIWSEDRQVRFTLSGSGDYVFKLVAVNGYERESAVFEYAIHIEKPFYFKWWFILVSLFTIIGLPTYYFFRRIRDTERSRLILEKKVEERTKELLTKSIEIEKQKDELSDSKAKIEHIHQDITDNIDYAKSIQESLLASEDLQNTNLSGSFILFEPKDQVSGDFYYIKKFGKNMVISAADCTGHGVSGAILTVLGITYLHEIVSREDIFDPGIALNQLREKIKATYETFGSERKDGLDIALCILNTESNMLSYAGAFNPLWLLRNKELIEFKATRNPIGVYFDEKSFKTHHIQLQKDDVFYIFSDGYPDQFGGPKEKKFKYKPFKKLLVDISELNMDDQHKILHKTFVDWKGQNEQTDDVTLIGVKV